MNPFYLVVARRAGNRCEYCLAPEAPFNFSHEVEHIAPRAEGGSDDHTNLALACRACNTHKSSFMLGFDETTQTSVRLFNPRLDSWIEHFRIDFLQCEIIGLTEIGRATIKRLRINSSTQIRARRLWLELRIFP